MDLELFRNSLQGVPADRVLLVWSGRDLNAAMAGFKGTGPMVGIRLELTTFPPWKAGRRKQASDPGDRPPSCLQVDPRDWLLIGLVKVFMWELRMQLV